MIGFICRTFVGSQKARADAMQRGFTSEISETSIYIFGGVVLLLVLLIALIARFSKKKR